MVVAQSCILPASCCGMLRTALPMYAAQSCILPAPKRGCHTCLPVNLCNRGNERVPFPAATLPQEPVALTAAFSGCGLREVAAFLRLVYSPDHATPTSLRHVHR